MAECIILGTVDNKEKVKAIKLYQEIVGCSLKEAKEIMDSAPVNIKIDIGEEEAEILCGKLMEIGVLATVADGRACDDIEEEDTDCTNDKKLESDNTVLDDAYNKNFEADKNQLLETYRKIKKAVDELIKKQNLLEVRMNELKNLQEEEQRIREETGLILNVGRVVVWIIWGISALLLLIAFPVGILGASCIIQI